MCATEIATQALLNVVVRRAVVAGQHGGAVLHFLGDQGFKQCLLGGEVTVKGAAGQTNGIHQGVHAGGFESALFGNGAAAGE